MRKLDLLPKKKRLNVGIIAVALIVLIVGAASSCCLSSASEYPTLSSMAGIYSNALTGTAITLYEDGTALFGTHDSIWHIVNATSFEISYIGVAGFRQFFEFRITNNGFTEAETGNVYIKAPSGNVPEPDSARIQQHIVRFNRDYDSSSNLHCCFSSKEREKNDLVKAFGQTTRKLKFEKLSFFVEHRRI